MFNEKILKLARSLIKKILPLIFKILIKFKINKRVINYLDNRSYQSNDIYEFSKIIVDLLKDKKIITLDAGAQGGFNSDKSFPSKYNKFFDDILIEPIKSEATKIKKKNTINKGLWSKKESKKLYILENRLGSSSMYKPDKKKFDIHNIKTKDYKDYEVTSTAEVECDSINNLLSDLKIQKLDYLKIDTQGAELEILKGLGDFRPLLLKVEAHVHSMYTGVPSWHRLLNHLYDQTWLHKRRTTYMLEFIPARLYQL